MSKSPRKNAPARATGLYFIDTPPKWFKDYCEKIYKLLNLQFFTVNIHFGSKRALNGRLRKFNYETFTGNEAASAFIDPVYLTADLFFITPIKNTFNARYDVFHEFLHIKLRYHTFDKVKMSLDANTRADEIKLLRVEEETCEAMLSVFDGLGFFSGAFA